jgi:hypothetical protein
MGGVSNSEMVLEDRFAVFRGTVSLENNGGFASFRMDVEWPDLRTEDGLCLRLFGDDRGGNTDHQDQGHHATHGLYLRTGTCGAFHQDYRSNTR